jgi:D-ribose pyranose/furanose isomerase RbsD
MRSLIQEIENRDSMLKQAFLKAEIMDKNYDAEQFLNFLLQKQPDKSDISYWSFDDLESQVFLFKQQMDLA